MHTHTYIHIHICAQPAASVFTDVYVRVKTHLCDIHTCPCTSTQNTCKVHVTLTAKKYTYIYTYTHMYTHTYAHENTCACMTPSTRWSTDIKTHNPCTNMYTHTHTHVYKGIDVQIHTHMHIHTYIHVRTHTHMYTHTCKMYTWTHATTPGMTVRHRTCKEPLQTKEALYFSFVRRNQTIFCTSNTRTSLYPRPAAPIPLRPPSPLPNIPQNRSRWRASTVLLFYTDQMNRVYSSEEAPRSFTMAPCVVVERLEGKQRCSRAAVSEHAGIQAWEW